MATELQPIFDRIVRGLREQGRFSMKKYGSCAYRGDGGTRCAVGFVIPDEVYDPQMDAIGVGVATLFENGHAWSDKLPVEIREPKVVELLSRLQDAHDVDAYGGGALEWGNLPSKLRRVAKRTGLDASSVDEASWPWRGEVE